MSDLISRQWLMECVNEGWIKFDTEKDENRFIHLVRDIAPSAQPEPITVNIDHELTQDEYEKLRKDMVNAPIMLLPSAQRWIPCKTELPDDDTEVIVSCTDDSGDGEFSYVTTGWHYKGLWVVNNDRCYFVKAWQPLPAKPWEGEQDESDD